MQTWAELIAKVREFVAKHPHGAYHKPGRAATGVHVQCSYFVGNAVNEANTEQLEVIGCGCLFGLVLKDYPDVYKFLHDGKPIDECLEDILAGATSEAHWCYLVQTYQDSGNEWAKCIEYADNYNR